MLVMVANSRAAAPTQAAAFPYPQAWRAQALPWWRPLLTLLVFAAVFAACMGLLRLLVLHTPLRGLVTNLPGMLLVLNISMACLIPASLLAVRIGMGRPAGLLLSVAGHLRWRWLLRAWLAGLPAMLLLVVLEWIWQHPDGVRLEQHAVWLLLMTLLLTPLQCAGEELAFRGVLAQVLGSWIRPTRLALLATLLLPSLLFALAHGQQEPGLLAARMALGALFAWLAWRSGGLEAPIALHTLNNQLVFLLGILTGTLRQSLFSADLPWSMVLAQLGVVALAAWWMLRVMRRR